MEHKRAGTHNPLNIWSFALALILLSSCQKDKNDCTNIFFYCDNESTKSSDPNEYIISDINYFIFDNDGKLSESAYLPNNYINTHGCRITTKSRIGSNLGYSIYACANIGYEIKHISSISDIEDLKFYLTYPDELLNGIPMSGHISNISTREDGSLDLRMKRLMAKISVSLDLSCLDSGIDFKVKRIGIGNCPKWAKIFSTSRSTAGYDNFINGFYKEGYELKGLNSKPSTACNLYMFENMQEEGRNTNLCSYIEILIEYISEEYEGDVKYEFYIGESEGDFNVKRNTNYNYVLCPEGTGMGNRKE